MCREETSVLHAAREMGRENIGMLPVSSDRGILKGVITDRDIVLKVLSSAVEKGVFPDDMSCGSIMTKDPVTVTPDTNIHDAALIFATRQVRNSLSSTTQNSWAYFPWGIWR
ncbi:MAG: CBS domain-containing protein [Anaerovoracaceae bacterium]